MKFFAEMNDSTKNSSYHMQGMQPVPSIPIASLQSTTYNNNDTGLEEDEQQSNIFKSKVGLLNDIVSELQM